jgi:ectoine hydroxylase-related dioxygenase (phytanoyl-CoA dioxygenase family)
MQIDGSFMKDSFITISADRDLPADAIESLDDAGFVVISGLIGPDRLKQLSAAYDFAFASAGSDDVAIGSTTTRIHDFVNRGPKFDELYLSQSLLKACSHVIRGPFKLSSMRARTLRSNVQAQELHVDFKPDETRFPLVSFIWMVDEFRSDNGATRFVPRSHKWSAVPHESKTESEKRTVTGCGPAGSVIIFNGSVLHGHSANTTGAPRRSIQGAFIPRDAEAATDFSTHMRPETLARISPLARYVLAV